MFGACQINVLLRTFIVFLYGQIKGYKSALSNTVGLICTCLCIESVDDSLYVGLLESVLV